MSIKIRVIYEYYKLLFNDFNFYTTKKIIEYKPVEHLVIIDVIKHHVLFQISTNFCCDVFNVSSVSRNFSCNYIEKKANIFRNITFFVLSQYLLYHVLQALIPLTVRY